MPLVNYDLLLKYIFKIRSVVTNGLGSKASWAYHDFVDKYISLTIISLSI